MYTVYRGVLHKGTKPRDGRCGNEWSARNGVLQEEEGRGLIFPIVFLKSSQVWNPPLRTYKLVFCLICQLVIPPCRFPSILETKSNFSDKLTWKIHFISWKDSRWISVVQKFSLDKFCIFFWYFHIIQCTLCTVYSRHYTLYTVHCTLQIIQRQLYS